MTISVHPSTADDIGFYRTQLVGEIRERARLLEQIAVTVEGLDPADGRLVDAAARGAHHCVDMLDAFEFLTEIEQFAPTWSIERTWGLTWAGYPTRKAKVVHVAPLTEPGETA